MGIQNVGALSLGQWISIVRVWNAAHATEETVAPPSEAEFMAAVAQARRLH